MLFSIPALDQPGFKRVIKNSGPFKRRLRKLDHWHRLIADMVCTGVPFGGLDHDHRALVDESISRLLERERIPDLQKFTDSVNQTEDRRAIPFLFWQDFLGGSLFVASALKESRARDFRLGTNRPLERAPHAALSPRLSTTVT